MIKSLAHFQLVPLFFYSSAAFHQFTGAGTGASLIVGGGGSFLVVILLFLNFPTVMVIVATLLWFTAGVMSGNFLFGPGGEAILLAIVCAAVGLVVNIFLLNQMRADSQMGAKYAESVLGPVISSNDRVAVMQVWHSARLLDRIGVLDADTYRDLNRFCAETLRLANPPDGSKPPQKDELSDAFDSLSILRNNGFIDEHQANKVLDRIEIWWDSKD